MTAANIRPDQNANAADDAASISDQRKQASPLPITVRIPDAARMLGLGRSKIYELIASGDIEIVKLGRSTLVPVASLHALIERLKREQLGGR